jgi:hypothetical protein
VKSFRQQLSNSHYVYVYILPHPPLHHHQPTPLSRCRFLATLGTKHIIEHAVPDLPHDTDLLLNGLCDSGDHEVGHGVEVDAVGVTVVRVGHGQDDGEGRGGDDFGFHDLLVGSLVTSPAYGLQGISARTYNLFDLRSVGACAGRGEVVGRDGHTHHNGAAGLGVVWVEVGKVGEIDGGRVVDGLESARSVEVTDSVGCGLCLGLGRAFRLLNGGAEGARAGDLVCGKTGDELWWVSFVVLGGE